MVGYTTLRKRHSLKGMKLLPVIRRVRETSGDELSKEWARVSAGKPTGDMGLTVRSTRVISSCVILLSLILD